jgi:hypothetical protein
MLSSLFRRLSTSSSDRRSEPRGGGVEGRIHLGGKAYPLKDWSRRGFSAGSYREEYYPGDKVALDVEVVVEKETLAFACEAVVVWVDRDREELAAVFTGLDPRIQDRIMSSVFAQQVAAGSMGGAVHA